MGTVWEGPYESFIRFYLYKLVYNKHYFGCWEMEKNPSKVPFSFTELFPKLLMRSKLQKTQLNLDSSKCTIGIGLFFSN